MYELYDTRVPGRGRKSLLFKCMERLADRVFPELHHRIATGLLVTPGDQGVERQGVVLWGDDLLLYQRAENAGLNWVESHSLRVPHRRFVHSSIEVLRLRQKDDNASKPAAGCLG